jgi:hypothetical protein
MATTTGTLAQNALNIAASLQTSILNGNAPDLSKQIFDLCGAVVALADAYYATLNAAATPALTTSVATSVSAIDSCYSATQTWPVAPQTEQR